LINLLPFLENRLITLLKMIVFWDIAPCRLTEVDRFRRAYFLHQGGGGGGDDDDGGTTHPRNAGLLSTRLHGIISYKAVIFILAAMRTEISHNNIV
jgi:hypothetical protein